MFIDIHVDAFAAELYAFDAETEALFSCGFASELDFAPGTDDALPG